MASVSSALLDLSMQQVSTQKNSKPSSAACFAQNVSLQYPALLLPVPLVKAEVAVVLKP
jgi:hypothetical protein